MNFDEMTLQELRNAAKELGIKGISTMKKGELAALLKAVNGRQQAAEKEQTKEESSTAGRQADKAVSGKKNVRKDAAESKEKTLRKKPEVRKEAEGKKDNENGRVRDNSRAEAVDMSLDSGKEAMVFLRLCRTDLDLSAVRITFRERMISMYPQPRLSVLI